MEFTRVNVLTLALEARLIESRNGRVGLSVGGVVRLKKWVKAVGNVFLFSMAFAHVCAAIFRLSIACTT